MRVDYDLTHSATNHKTGGSSSSEGIENSIPDSVIDLTDILGRLSSKNIENSIDISRFVNVV